MNTRQKRRSRRVKAAVRPACNTALTHTCILLIKARLRQER